MMDGGVLGWWGCRLMGGGVLGWWGGGVVGWWSVRWLGGVRVVGHRMMGGQLLEW